MKNRNNLLLVIIVVILGCGLYLLDEHLEHRQTARVQIQRVFDITTEPITAASFESSGQRIEFVRKGESWFLQEPVRARANSPQVERIVSQLETLRRQDTITREQREQLGISLTDYGLQDANRHISIETANGRAEILHVGDETPFGKAIYGKLERSDLVFTLPTSVLELFPDDLSALRDRTLLYGTPAKTERIDIHRRGAGFLQLVRQKSGWVLQQPLAVKADPVAVRNLLDTLFDLRVTTFHWDAEPDGETDEQDAAQHEMTRLGQFETAGLAEDAARFKITVWTEGDRLGQDLLIGTAVKDAANQNFARRGGVDAIYTIPSAIIEACSQPVERFRSRNVFHWSASDIGFISLRHNDTLLELERLKEGNKPPEWRLLTPLHAPAAPEAVQTLITRLLELRTKTFLDSASSETNTIHAVSPMQITLATSAPDNKNIPDSSTTLLLGEAADGLRAATIATRENDRFALDAAKTADLDSSLISPLHFRHPLMLSVDASAVTRIEVQGPSETSVVARNTETPTIWHCPEDENLIVNPSAIADLLTTAARIEAADFVAFMPSDRSDFGLDTPFATVTFGYRADEGLQNALLLGSTADVAWRYAMIQGHEFVFLLPVNSIKKLMQPLFTTPPEPPVRSPLQPTTNAVPTNTATAIKPPASTTP